MSVPAFELLLPEVSIPNNLTCIFPMHPVFFSSPAQLRQWLEQHHSTETALLVGFYKKGTGRPTLTWSESVDEALCFGWIDGTGRSIDSESYCIRFTPRRPRSIWSVVNIKKVEGLLREGRVAPAGLAAFEKREAARSGVYSFEQAQVQLEPDMEAAFRSDKGAWSFFGTTPPAYRKAAIWWVISAKRAPTRAKRFRELLEVSAAGKRLKHLQRPEQKG
jgi:uncharacterized protein YdeI (YjbR/CyaY-like superfamily)